MKRINSLNDLLMEELADLLSAENQLTRALPKMAEASQSPILKNAFEDHLEVTKVQADRLHDIFSNIGQDSQWVISKAMKRLIEEIEDIVNRTEKGTARDADIISVVQRVKHYEIVGYQTACEHASDLGHPRMLGLLIETLDEERAMNLRLNELVQGMINVQAINSTSS